MKESALSWIKRLTIWDYVLLILALAGILIVMPVILAKRFQEAPVVEHLASETKPSESLIWVDVSGGVTKPGAYQLKDGDRIKDAIVAAGGLAASADRDLMARMVNLAEIVKDGQKVFIPVKGEVVKGTSIANQTVRSLTNINTASQAELENLWGVGPSRAVEIIKGRPYKNLDELVTRKILTKNILDRNKDQLSVY